MKRSVYILIAIIAVVVGVVLWFTLKSAPKPITGPVATTTATSTVSTATSTKPLPVMRATYRNSTDGYRIDYWTDMKVTENTGIPSGQNNITFGTIIELPKKYLGTGTYADAAIYLAKTPDNCSKALDGVNSFVVSRTYKAPVYSFAVTNISDAGAGNFYQDTQYALSQGSVCYRIVLHEHIINPAPVYGDNTVAIQKAEEANAKTRKQLRSLVEQIVDTFALIK